MNLSAIITPSLMLVFATHAEIPELQASTSDTHANSENQLVGLQNQLIKAGEQFQAAPIPSTPVLCRCEDLCSGRCFAPSCRPCNADTWDGDEASCLNADPLGQGLLCESPVSTQRLCCQPSGAACRLEGGDWCDCGAYPKQAPLFPPLATRVYVNGRCVPRGAIEEHEQEEVTVDGDEEADAGGEIEANPDGDNGAAGGGGGDNDDVSDGGGGDESGANSAEEHEQDEATVDGDGRAGAGGETEANPDGDNGAAGGGGGGGGGGNDNISDVDGGDDSGANSATRVAAALAIAAGVVAL